MADFCQVGTLDLGVDSIELSAQGILAGGVNHLLLDLGGIGCPDRVRID